MANLPTHRCRNAESLMVHGSIRLLLLLAATVSMAACSSAPAVRYHTLMPADMPVRVPGAAPPSAQLAIVLEPIRVPAQVDQPQWLVRLADGSLAVLEQDRWASALSDELRQALREQLIAGFGASEARPAAGIGTIRIGVDVRRFDSVFAKEARIEGTWTLGVGDAGAARVTRCDWFLREPAGSGSPSLAAAHRRAVARLGDAIGAALSKFSRNEPVICPAVDAAV